jgi:hypothetical protein
MKIKGWGVLIKNLKLNRSTSPKGCVAYSLTPPHSHRNTCGKEYNYGIL